MAIHDFKTDRSVEQKPIYFNEFECGPGAVSPKGMTGPIGPSCSGAAGPSGPLLEPPAVWAETPAKIKPPRKVGDHGRYLGISYVVIGVSSDQKKITIQYLAGGFISSVDVPDAAL
jgi:hypothetical protein